jgi:hypothetical protein
VKGIYYGQSLEAEDADGETINIGNDAPAAYKAIISVNQDFLKFTSLWLEYGSYEQGFWARNGINAGIMDFPDYAGKSNGKTALGGVGSRLLNDTTMYRIAAEQAWNEKWTTYLFYTAYDVDTKDTFNHYGLAVGYRLNPNVAFGLAYSAFTYEDAFGFEDESNIHFRTVVTF